MSDDTGSLAETRQALRVEIGPPTDRDNKWQPMVSAGEVRLLLDALDAADARVAAARADALEEAAAAIPWTADAPGWLRGRAAALRAVGETTEEGK